ncbi:MAG: glycosyltransferase family 39 protein [Syntrophobacterales bacterium]|nr:glycosyltransferase family 39 protein [Syntrophobacterales bacterium]
MELPQSPASASRLLNGATLVLVCLGLYLPLFWYLPLLRSEAMYALIPREMLAAGSWLTPTLNGVHYLDKPHLIYWLNLLGYKLLGVSEWTARVPTLAVTVGEVWLTYLIGRRLVGQVAAWLGGFILLSCIGFFVLHLQILTDHLITLSLLAALYGLLRWQEQPRFRWTALFFLSLVAGFLSKGFIGVVFPGLIGGLYAWRLRDRRLLGLFFSPAGLTLMVGLLAVWAVASELANPGYLKFQIVNEQLMRFLGRREPPDVNTFTITGFWLFLGIWLMPWTFILPEGLYRFRQASHPGREIGPAGDLLLIWIAVILVFFTLSSSRIEYYSLPALPALALILGWRVRRYLDTPGDRVIPWTLLALGLLGLSLLVLLPLLERICVDNRREFIGMFQRVCPIAGRATWFIPAAALAGAAAAWLRRPPLAVAAYGVLAVGIVWFTFQTMGVLSPLLCDKVQAEYIRQVAAPQDLVVMGPIEEFEYGACLEFYTERRILMVKRHGLPQFPYPVPPETDYIISPERLQELWQGPRKVFLLLDDATPPDSFLQNATVALTLPGKRLLVNHP